MSYGVVSLTLGSGWVRDDWPDCIDVYNHGSHEPVKTYMPERTCRIYETDSEYEDSVRCSKCKKTFHRPWQPFRYCQNCGAKVIGDVEHGA